MIIPITITPTGFASMDPDKQIRVFKGQNANITFQIYSDTAQSVLKDLTDYEVSFRAKENINDTSYVLEYLDDSVYWDKTDIIDGEVTLELPEADIDTAISLLSQLTIVDTDTGFISKSPFILFGVVESI